MTAVSLKEILPDALEKGYAIPGFVVLGWEDAISFVEASEELNLPIILQAGPACRQHTPIPVLGKMFRDLADKAKTKIVCQLDHATSEKECETAVNEGFTSVMFDGSALNLNENIKQTLSVCNLIRKHDVSVEAELGFVGYNNSSKSSLTNPDEAKIFVEQTKIDALAISIGNVHLQKRQQNNINLDLLKEIEQKTSCPLVLHGSSGISYKSRRHLALNTSICKFNIGTELRQEFGKNLRLILEKKKNEFDRIKILTELIQPLKEAAKKIILNAFYNFSKNLGDFAKKAFENNWIDISPRKGKVGGAFCDNLPQINQSRILVNFTGTLSDVLTLAHELGHGFHGEMISRNTPLNWDYPMPLAETASIFCESIVNEFLINNVKNDNELLNILENELQDNTQVIIDILSRYYFESKLFDEANKPLNVEDINLWMKDSQKKAYLDGLDKNVLHPYMWLIKSHYYDAEYNFYNFPYAFGLLFGKALFTKYKENPTQFTTDYEIFLQFTPKDSIEEVSKKIGIGLNSETFWNNSFRIIKENITRVINLIDKIKDAN